MLNKRALLASSALAVLGSVSSAQAGDGIYFSFSGGANFQEDRTVSGGFLFGGGSATVDPDTGFLLNAAVGTHLDRWLHGLRTELEASYRHNNAGGDFEGGTIFFGGTSGPIDARVSTFAVLANVWYDIDVGHKWVPYIGGGAGGARSQFDGALVGLGAFSAENNGFAYQLGGGVNYEIQDGVNLGMGYRYFRGPNIRSNVFFGKLGAIPVEAENENHSVLISLTIDTN